LHIRIQKTYIKVPFSPLLQQPSSGNTGNLPHPALKNLSLSVQSMVASEKVRALCELASYDMEQEQEIKHISLGENKPPPYVYDAKTPMGKCTLFKTLMTNNCKIPCTNQRETNLFGCT